MRRLSDLPDDEAREALGACCGSHRWVERMLSQRPFRDRDDVFDSADRIWWDLERTDWLEAFSAHPKIGDTTATGVRAYGEKLAQGWSSAEQSGAGAASELMKAELTRANEEYQRRFGYIYIVCATGKGAAELLDICRSRLENPPELEIRVSAAEQVMITRLRLHKLLALGE